MKTFYSYSIYTLFFLTTYNSFSQSSGLNYVFTQPADSMIYNNSTVGSVTVIPGGVDDQAVTITIPSGWTGFYFGGTWFPQGSQLTISSNGWMLFDIQGSSQPQNNLWLSPFTIAPLWDDLKIHADGEISYLVSGGVGSRSLVVEWRGMLWDHNATDSALSFQAIIYDNAQTDSSMRNVIEFRYKRNGTDAAYVLNNSGGASIGISGSCGDVFAFTNSTGAPNHDSPEYSAIALKPDDVVSHRFTPQIHPNDECATAEVLAFNPAVPLIAVDASTLHSTQSSGNIPLCGSPATMNDVWFTFTKPADITNFEIFTDSLDCRGMNYATGIEIYSDCGITMISCDYGSAGPGNTNAVSYLNLINQTCSAQQYWVRAYTLDSALRGFFRFNLRPPGSVCENANDITGCGIPYSSSLNLSTCGFGNDYDSMLHQPHTPYMHGEDYLFKYIPAASVCVNVSLSNTPLNSNPGLFIYAGCSATAACIGYVTGSGGTTLNFNNVSLSPGTDYYFLIDNDSTGGQGCITSFDLEINISSSSPAPNDFCAAAVNIPVLSSSTCTGSIDYNTNCATPSPALTLPIPGCGFFVDGVSTDVWFTFTSTGTTVHQIQVDAGTAPAALDLAMAVYTGNCTSMTLVTCDDQSNGMMPLLAMVPASAGITYYVRVWSNTGTQPGNFRICVSDGCTCPNDFCSTAIPLTVGQYAPGDNSCATGANEPGGPVSCWIVQSPFQLNTVWYSFLATDDTMKIRTHLISLYDSQIALYESTGGCGGTFTQIFCNENTIGRCNFTQSRSSQITATGLTLGNTYYIRVDGTHSNTGTFEIIVLPATDPYPPLYAQDCPLPISVCNNAAIYSPSPAYNDAGNYCDVAPGSTCLALGEMNSVFYTFSVTGTGAGTPVEFTINPDGLANYDFMLWCIDTTVNGGDHIPAIPNYCDHLANSFMFMSAVCNYSLQGITGCSTSAGLCPMPCHQSYGYSDPGIMPAVVVPDGITATFLLLVNHNYYHQGFLIDWMGTPINNSSQNMIWQGGTSTDWSDSSNWGSGDCAQIPDCNNGIGAVISGGGFSPVITTDTYVSDITINPGATLNIAAGVTLYVCGDFVNDGLLNCGAGSTVKFIGNLNASVIGSGVQSANTFQNFEAAKDSGTQLTLQSHLFVEGNFSVTSGIFVTNTQDLDLGGDFYNYNGSNSFVSTIPTHILFTQLSLAPQHFRNDGSSLILTNVIMNQTGIGMLLLDTNSTSDLIINNGSLNLISGIIKTGQQRQVNISSSQLAACNAGNSLSYVQGNLQRSIAQTTGAYEFPVGDSIKGYQRFTVDFTVAPASAYSILAKFSRWSGLPVSPPVSECTNSGWDLLPVFDNGYWTLDASTLLGLGTYTAIAYPSAVLNSVGLTFSIMKAPSNNGLGPWSMDGLPVCPGTPAQVERSSLTSFSDFAIVQSDIGNGSHAEETELQTIQLLPNPSTKMTRLAFTSSVNGTGRLMLKDVTGRMMFNREMKINAGNNVIDISLEGFPAGLYAVTLITENTIQSRKLIVD